MSTVPALGEAVPLSWSLNRSSQLVFKTGTTQKMGGWLNKLSLHFWTIHGSDRKWWG